MKKVDNFTAFIHKTCSYCTRLKQRILYFFTILTCPSIALAGFGGESGDTVTEVVNNICGWLSGAPAIAVGVLAVMYSGYEMFHGEINKKALIIRCVAVALVIGGAHIGKDIIMKGLQS